MRVCPYDIIIAGFANSLEFNGICNAYGINPGALKLTQYRDMNRNVTAFV